MEVLCRYCYENLESDIYHLVNSLKAVFLEKNVQGDDLLLAHTERPVKMCLKRLLKSSIVMGATMGSVLTP